MPSPTDDLIQYSHQPYKVGIPGISIKANQEAEHKD
jgi:hypothetical protein